MAKSLLRGVDKSGSAHQLITYNSHMKTTTRCLKYTMFEKGSSVLDMTSGKGIITNIFLLDRQSWK